MQQNHTGWICSLYLCWDFLVPRLSKGGTVSFQFQTVAGCNTLPVHGCCHSPCLTGTVHLTTTHCVQVVYYRGRDDAIPNWWGPQQDILHRVWQTRRPENLPQQQILATLEQDGPTLGDALCQCNNARQVLCHHALKGCHSVSTGSTINIPGLVGIIRGFEPVQQPLGWQQWSMAMVQSHRRVTLHCPQWLVHGQRVDGTLLGRDCHLLPGIAVLAECISDRRVWFRQQLTWWATGCCPCTTDSPSSRSWPCRVVSNGDAPLRQPRGLVAWQ
jgi:hypothetical protein